ncbi:MAG: hypothetical protein KY452_00400 [Actinobacteria bacterium]|nr:hypothetical protein [Actinomycetota bacterium]
MSQRHAGLVLLLVVALAAFGLSVAVDATGDRGSADDRAGAAFAQRAPGVDPSAARLRVEERPGAASQRLLKERPILLALVAALLVLPVRGRRRAVDVAQAWGVSVSWWLPPLGRAPPALFHS